MKNFIQFVGWQLLNIILSIGVGVNVSIMTGSKSLGQVLTIFMVFIISLVICKDHYPNGIRGKK